MKLPVLAARSAETTLCTYCPKLCRPACPVSTVEGRETVTPWGKMRAMGELLRDTAEPDTAHVAPAYACTGCLHCRELCELDNPVADTLRDGRAEAFTLGTAPAAALELARTFASREARITQMAAELPRDSAVARGSDAVGFVPGCTSVVFERGTVARLMTAVGALAGASCRTVADACCGLPLLEAGDRMGFVTRARAMGVRLAGLARVVVADAGCAHAMRVIYPAFGVALPPVEHITELAAGALDRLAPRADVPPRGAVLYHDACRLGRGLGLYDPPRAVLTRLLGGRAPGELPANRNRAPCSGAGGLLPRTRPATAEGIARELEREARGARGEAAETVLVTGCPSSRRHLAKRTKLAVEDLNAWIADAVR